MKYKILERIHTALIANTYTRPYQYRMLRCLRRLARCPDAFEDLYNIAKKTHPTAILDIGSFVGDTTARFLDELKITIHAFEPTPSSFYKLQHRFSSNELVTVHNIALCNRDGSMQFFSNENPQTNSLLDNDIGNELSWGDKTNHIALLKVEAMTLDRWTAENLPDGNLLIKADIQGAEGLLLDGGRKVFSHRVIAFYTEAQLTNMYKGQITFAELHSRLSNEFGFYLRNIYTSMHDTKGQAVQLDALWTNDKLLY